MKTLAGVSVVPFQRAALGLVKAGVFDKTGARVDCGPLLISSHANRPWFPRHAPRVAFEDVSGDFIYGGALYTGFGHFITETLPALVAINRAAGPLDNRRIVFQSLTPSPVPIAAIQAPHLTFFLNRIGISPDRIICVERPTRFEHLTIVPSAFSAKYRYRPAMAGLLDRALSPDGNAGGRHIYFSRTRIAGKVDRGGDEARLEDIFAGQGFEIIHPQEMTPTEQFQLICDTRVVAGLNGSALHWSLLSPSVRCVLSLGWHLGLQQGICRLRDQRYVNPRGTIMSRLKGRHRSFSDAAVLRAISQARA